MSGAAVNGRTADAIGATASGTGQQPATLDGVHTARPMKQVDYASACVPAIGACTTATLRSWRAGLDGAYKEGSERRPQVCPEPPLVILVWRG